MSLKAELHASAAETATGNGTAKPLVYRRGDAGFLYGEVVFELDVTNADTDVADKLDVFVQTKVGLQWIDVVHFTQISGTDSAMTFIAKIVSGVAETMYELASALAAGAERNIIGPEFRVRWVIVDDTTPTFTFSVNVIGNAR